MHKSFTGIFSVVAVLVLTLALAGCAGGKSSSPVDNVSLSPVNPFELSIRVGRMGVMLDQGEKALGIIAARRGVSLSTEPTNDSAARRALYADLSQAVLTHNRLWVKACAVDASLTVCQNMFEPGWMGLPFSHSPTWRQLDMWSGQVETQVGALAGELCTKAEQASGTRPLCPIE